jgi:hypothetical protein
MRARLRRNSRFPHLSRARPKGLFCIRTARLKTMYKQPITMQLHPANLVGSHVGNPSPPMCLNPSTSLPFCFLIFLLFSFLFFLPFPFSSHLTHPIQSNPIQFNSIYNTIHNKINLISSQHKLQQTHLILSQICTKFPTLSHLISSHSQQKSKQKTHKIHIIKELTQ